MRLDPAMGSASPTVLLICGSPSDLDLLLECEDALGEVEVAAMPGDDGSTVEVIVDKALAEARQQATALKQIVGELRQSAGAEKPATGGSVLDQLAARRAARVANTAR